MQNPEEVPGGIFKSTVAARSERAEEAVPLARQYLQILWRNRLLVNAAIFSSLILGLTITLLMTPKYSATAMIEIRRESGKILNVQGVEREATTADQEFYQTQYGLLESRTLANRVATSLRLADDPNFFKAYGELPEKPSWVLNSAGRFVNAGREERQEAASQTLLRSLDVSPVRGSSLVKIVFKTSDPKLSTQLANSWARIFIDLSLERRYEATSYARSFLEKRLAELRTRLETTERQLVAYAADQQVVNVPVSGDDGAQSGPERSIVAETLGQLNQYLTQATGERIQAQSRLLAGLPEQALDNVGISNLRAKRAEVSADYARMIAQFEPSYPPARQLASQLAQLDQAINREEDRVKGAVRNRYNEAVEREEKLKQQVELAKSQMLEQRRRSIQYNIFLRDVDTNRALYDGLLQRYKEIGVAGGIGVNNISIIDFAKVPEAPSSPVMILNLALAGFFGLLAGIGLAILREHLSDRIGDASEIDRKLGAPMVGLIPKIADLTLHTELSDRKSPFVEAFLATQANLAMATQHGFPRSFAVTSTRPAEGKSSSAFALAVTLSRSGKRVLLIDADMRRPSLHHVLRRQPGNGLSAYLSGQEVVDALIQKTEFENLDCILAGATPPNAAELLSGSGLSELIEKSLATYDHVLIDSPPVLGLADAPLIGSQVEGVVYVVEFHGMRTSAIRVALDRLRMTGAHVFGIMLTKYDAKKSGYGYGYGYGYSYDYSYGERSSS